MSSFTRRHFIKTAALATAGAALSARAWSQVAGANGDIRIGIVGLNGKGRDHFRFFSAVPGVRIVALCDVDSAVLERAAQTAREAKADVKTYADARELFASPEVDAVSIATPNHQHALQAIWAMQAGKDVYVEKPVSHNLWEGAQLVAAATKYHRIVQAGTQSRSSEAIAGAIAWVRAGHVGRITAARMLCYKRRPSIGLTSGPQAVPATVNYDLWLGPAPLTPLRRARLHYDWHWQWATGNGDIGNQGAHQIDIARRFLGEPAFAPRVFTIGGRLGYVDDGETPNTLIAVHDYAAAPLICEVRGLPAHGTPAAEGGAGGSGPVGTAGAGGTRGAGGRGGGGRGLAGGMDQYRGVGIGNVIECEGGYVVVPATDYSGAHACDRDGKVVQEFTGVSSHYANFVAAVRSRKTSDLHAPIHEGYVSTGLCHTTNISYELGRAAPAGEVRERIKGDAALAEGFGRMAEHLASNGLDLAKTPATLGLPVTLDAQAGRFTGEGAAAANALLTREYRAPFVVPRLV